MRRSIVRGCLTLLLAVTMTAACCGADDTAPAPAEPFTVATDEATGRTIITLPARDGQVQCPDIARALARAGRLDDSALDLLPPGHLDLNDARARFAVEALNLAFPSEIDLAIRRGTGDVEPALVVTIDEPGLKQRSRDIRRRIRERLGDDADRFGLTFDTGANSPAADGPVVVLVHGYNSTTGSLDELRTVLQARGFACGMFAYPNDGPLDKSAVLLADELRQLRATLPGREVALVAHSMGGLVARAVVEDPRLDPDNVRRLILVATPNHGSQLACFPGGPDCVDAFCRDHGHGIDDIFRNATIDGLDEACEDMQPESDFLRTLNARERNPRVKYSLLIGTRGPLTEASLAEVRAGVRTAIERDRIARLLGPRIEGPLSDFDEVVRDKGDGAVAVKRARLEGVDDTVLLPFSHLAISRKATEPEAAALLGAIVERLATKG